MCTEREIVRETMSAAPQSEMDVAMEMDVHSAAMVLEKIPENSRPLGWSRTTSRIPSKPAPRSSTPELQPEVAKRIPSAAPPRKTPAVQEKPMEGELASRVEEPLSSPSALPSKHLHASSEAGKAPAVPSTHGRASPASGASGVKSVSHTVSSSVPGQFAKFSSLMSQLARSSSSQSASPGPSASRALFGSDSRSPVPSSGLTKSPSLSSSSSRARLSQVPLSSPSDAKARPSASAKPSADGSSLPSSSASRPSSPSRTGVKPANSFPVASSSTVNKAARSPSPSRIGSQSPLSAPPVARPSSPSLSRPSSQSSVASAHRPSTPTRAGAPSAATPKARTSTPTRRTDAPRSLNSGSPAAKSSSSSSSPNPAASSTPCPSSTSSSSLISDNVVTRPSSPALPSAKSASLRSPSVHGATQPVAPSRSSLKSSSSSSSSSLTAVNASSTCRPASPSRTVGKSSGSSSCLTPARPASPSRVAKHSVSSSSSASPGIVASCPASPLRPVPKSSTSSLTAVNVTARPASPSRVAKFSGSNSSALPPITVVNWAASPSRPVAKSLGVSSSNLPDRSSAAKGSPSATTVSSHPSIPTRSLTKAVKSPLPLTAKVPADSSIPARHSRSASWSSLNVANLRPVPSAAATQNHTRSSPSDSPKSTASSEDGTSDSPSSSGNVAAVKKSVQEFQVQQLRISGRKYNPASPKSCARIVPEDLPVSPLTLNAKKRCGWITSQSDGALVAYHDEEWGTPIYDDKLLFELLVLEGAQAEFSWSSILALRDDFRVAFTGFDPAVVAKFDEKKIATLMGNPKIPIPEARIRGTVDNAKCVLEIAEECGSLSTFLWGFVNHKPVVSNYKLAKQVPVKTPKSEVLSNELVRRGFRFVGPTTMYALMQAAGLVNDHLVTCFRHKECESMHDSSPPIHKAIQPAKERWNQTDDDLWAFASDFNSKTSPAFEPGHWLNLPGMDTNSRQRSTPYEPVWAELPMIEEDFEDEIERQA